MITDNNFKPLLIICASAELFNVRLLLVHYGGDAADPVAMKHPIVVLVGHRSRNANLLS